jgi:hypothetical protein
MMGISLPFVKAVEVKSRLIAAPSFQLNSVAQKARNEVKTGFNTSSIQRQCQIKISTWKLAVSPLDGD